MQQVVWLFRLSSNPCQHSPPWTNSLYQEIFHQFETTPSDHGTAHGRHHKLWRDIWLVAHWILWPEFLLPAVEKKVMRKKFTGAVFGRLTFSHNVLTWFSANCLHSLSCSIHWSSSLTTAFSSILMADCVSVESGQRAAIVSNCDRVGQRNQISYTKKWFSNGGHPLSHFSTEL